MNDPERAKILLQAMVDILEKMEKSRYVLNFVDQTAIWDGTECDGGCLLEETKIWLEMNQ